jgi:hypothetical protein
MDRLKVASAVKRMLDIAGAAVQVDAPGYRPQELQESNQRGDLPYPPPPDDAIDDLRRQYLGPDLRAGQGIRNTSPSGEDDIFQEAGFRPAREVEVPDGRVLTRNVDALVAQRFSNSSTAPHLFGAQAAAFELDLRRLLMEASPSGLFAVRLPDNLLRIWRLP